MVAPVSGGNVLSHTRWHDAFVAFGIVPHNAMQLVMVFVPASIPVHNQLHVETDIRRKKSAIHLLQFSLHYHEVCSSCCSCTWQMWQTIIVCHICQVHVTLNALVFVNFLEKSSIGLSVAGELSQRTLSTEWFELKAPFKRSSHESSLQSNQDLSGPASRCSFENFTTGSHKLRADVRQTWQSLLVFQVALICCRAFFNIQACGLFIKQD